MMQNSEHENAEEILAMTAEEFQARQRPLLEQRARHDFERKDSFLQALVPVLKQNKGIQIDLFFTGSSDNSEVEDVFHAANVDTSGDLYFTDGAGNRLEQPTKIVDLAEMFLDDGLPVGTGKIRVMDDWPNKPADVHMRQDRAFDDKVNLFYKDQRSGAAAWRMTIAGESKQGGWYMPEYAEQRFHMGVIWANPKERNVLYVRTYKTYVHAVSLLGDDFTAKEWRTFADALTARNERMGLPSPFPLTPSAKERVEPSLSTKKARQNTSQEMTTYNYGLANGRTLTDWHENEQNLTMVYIPKGSPHSVSVGLTDAEVAAGLRLDLIEGMIRDRCADDIWGVMFMLNALVPVMPLLPNTTPTGWIETADVAKFMGLRPDHLSPKELGDALQKAYSLIQYGDRAKITGERTGHYRRGKEVFPTQISGSSLWRINNVESPEQPGLFPGMDTPRRVNISISPDMIPLLYSPDLAEYVDYGERLAGIAASKPGGAWARVIGFRLFTHWRTHALKTYRDRMPLHQLTRAELLTKCPPKTAPLNDILSSGNPGHAIEYYAAALDELVSAGVLAPTHAAAPDVRKKRTATALGLPRQGWAQEWKNAPQDLRPGADVEQALIAAVITAPAKALPSPPKRQGRPPKKE